MKRYALAAAVAAIVVTGAVSSADAQDIRVRVESQPAVVTLPVPPVTLQDGDNGDRYFFNDDHWWFKTVGNDWLWFDENRAEWIEYRTAASTTVRVERPVVVTPERRVIVEDRTDNRYDPRYDPRYDYDRNDPRYSPRYDRNDPRYDSRVDPRYGPRYGAGPRYPGDPVYRAPGYQSREEAIGAGIGAGVGGRIGGSEGAAVGRAIGRAIGDAVED